MDIWSQVGLVAAAWVIVLVFTVQCVFLWQLYRLAKSLAKMVQDVRANLEPQVSGVMTTVKELQKTAADLSQTATVVSSEARAVSAAVKTSTERIAVIATDGAEEIRSLITEASAEIKAMVAITSSEVQGMVLDTSGEVRGIVRTTRDSTEMMLARLDLMVERSALRVEDTGVYVQTQVIQPVREVSAIVIGIKTALETLLGYPERKPINQAYSEEELFI